MHRYRFITKHQLVTANSCYLNSREELGAKFSKKDGLNLFNFNKNKILVNVSACLPSSGHKLINAICNLNNHTHEIEEHI